MKTKLLLIIMFFGFVELSAQKEYVVYDNYIYRFLERMETLGIIDNYNSFEIPKTRSVVADYIKEIKENMDLLDPIDKNILNDLLVEFETELTGKADSSIALIGSESYDFFSDKQKYLFALSDSSLANIFINIIGKGNFIFNNNYTGNINNSAFAGAAGLQIRGTISENFGFFVNVLQGNVFGNKEAARIDRELRYNYKLFETADETFFDETSGYLTADFNLVKFKLGRDRMQTGYGMNKLILDDQSPMFDYIKMDLSYKFFSFTYFHGKLLGDVTVIDDTISGNFREIKEKYVGYHRAGFNISEHLDFGIGEIIVYGDRPPDLSYINPFSYYKSVEHSNRDRDNSMIFIDINNNSLRNFKFYSTLLVDDISYDKIGTGFYGNKVATTAGMFTTVFNDYFPLDLEFQYSRLEPYVFSHRLSKNKFTNYDFPLSGIMQPNSERFTFGVYYRFTNRILLQGSFAYEIHGDNPKDENGVVIRNVGGDINLGHREFDSHTVSFLDGVREYSRIFSASVLMEPVNQYFINFKILYFNQTLQNEGKSESLNAFVNVSVSF